MGHEGFVLRVGFVWFVLENPKFNTMTMSDQNSQSVSIKLLGQLKNHGVRTLLCLFKKRPSELPPMQWSWSDPC